MKAQINYEQLLEGLNSRAAIKKFIPPTTSKDEVESVIERTKDILRLSPSSYGLQPYKFLIITNPEIREKLKSHAYGQSQITDSDFLVVFCVKTNIDESTIDEYMDLVSQVRGAGKDQLDGYRQAILNNVNRLNFEGRKHWATKQAYIALGNVLTSLSLIGVDSCPMEGFDAHGFDEVLSLKGMDLTSVVLLSVGHRSKEDPSHYQPKVRFPKEKLFIDYQ